MSKCSQLGALMKKNLILMKRNCCMTVCEILFPIILMFLLVMVRRAIQVEEYGGDFDEYEFIKANSTALISPQEFPNVEVVIKGDQTEQMDPLAQMEQIEMSWKSLTVKNPFLICYLRPIIATIGENEQMTNLKARLSILLDLLKLAAQNSEFSDFSLGFKDFKTVEEANEYVKSPEYGTSEDKPELCFGFYLNKKSDDEWEYSLHYFDSWIRGAAHDTPTTLRAPLDPFQRGPDVDDYEKWLNSGYFLVMKYMNDAILQDVTGVADAAINFGILSQKYTEYKEDPFRSFLGFLLPFFLIIAYLAPLCVLVFRMVQEKESRAKEGMKIMGLHESVYFFSYFLHWLVINTIYSIINSLIITRVLTNIPLAYIFAFFWLFGMCIFSLAYFFQSLMDRTRIAMIISILVYFIMFFVSVAVISEDVENVAKMFMSLLPPTCLQLGIQVLAKYESSFVAFKASDVSKPYNNYSVGNMYVMLFIDFLLYLFLGYYFNNVLTHQFGIRRPWYFLCSSQYWCKKKRVTSQIIEEANSQAYLKIEVNRQQKDIPASNFQSEQNYDERIRTGDAFQIKNLKKTFDDGKIAVDGLNLNLYNGEIFALLGHNGAGKSTTISILCGLYEATAGTASYQGINILDEENMETFRKKLGICPQHDVLFGDLSVKEHLNMFCIFKGVDSDIIDGEITKILSDVHMTEKADELAKNLSGGQKRKLSIAIALIGGSEVVFLDEPSSGMDITSRRNLWDILKKCVGNRIIVLTTHYMEEAAVLGDRIGIVSSGKLKCCGNGLFLIDRFGKYISLNIYKNPGANDREIIDYMKSLIPGVEYEILSEEILFRIPKVDIRNRDGNEINIMENFSFKKFFTELDANLDNLRIKSYAASMPTLEDVFLNVSADSNSKLIYEGDQDQAQGLQDMRIKEEDIGACSKFLIDLKCSLKKRFLQIIRDKKTFMLEILCPILLVLIGLGVSSVQFVKDSPSLTLDIGLLPTGQKIAINSHLPNGDPLPYKFENYNENLNLTFNFQENTNGADFQTSMMGMVNKVYEINDTASYGSFFISKWDTTNQQYEFVTLPNIEARFGALIYSDYMLKQIISHAAGREIKIDFKHSPFPLTSKWRERGETRNNSNLVFFVSVAFALIPANFITIIIKERESNTKHLQIISGISLSSYWISNYIFELMKYYFIGGVNLLLILAFDNFPSYLWLLYLLYGFSMTSFTYMFTLFFKTESTAQNVVILVNFLFGALGGSVILILRILEDLIEIGKVLAYIFRVIPSFAFSYGFNQLLSSQILFVIDYPDNFITMVQNEDEYIIKPEYTGADVLFLGVESIVYLLVLILAEAFRNSCHKKKSSLGDPNGDYNRINDSVVKREIEKANMLESDSSEQKKYSIKVKNLEKYYSKGCCGDDFKAVDKLSFCLEFGECFALLGVNGAGKTTTFKALTYEDLASSGEIYINGLELTSNFNKVRNLIGYCPQFDAIFDYMTVEENLNFYAQVKGISSEKIDDVVELLMKEMNLLQYKDKVSGNLSGGNKRKLSVAIAMIGNPPIVLLDEPSTGMDPEARRFMWAVIHKISTRSKMSSVILTTHSMEEAETLCRRMGIMVNGQFKCLGTGQSIKDKYGFGYEIDLRVQSMPEAMLNEILHVNNFNPNDTVDSGSKIETVLNRIGKSNFISQFGNAHLLGSELYEELSIKGRITVKKLIEWTFNTENTLRCIDKILDYFNDVSISEYWENNFKLKLKKTEEKKTIGFLFGLMEDQKLDCFLAEYSISQTSLEQIFNKFASEVDEGVYKVQNKKEMKIDKNFIAQMLGSDIKFK